MKQALPRAKARAGRRVAKAGFEMLYCVDVISGQMIGGSRHRFSERKIVGILGFQGHLFASRGNIELTINVVVPTVTHEEAAQELQLGGKVSLNDRNVQRPRKSLANTLAAPFGLHQREGQ